MKFIRVIKEGGEIINIKAKCITLVIDKGEKRIICTKSGGNIETIDSEQSILEQLGS